jgi:hypothetical protein
MHNQKRREDVADANACNRISRPESEFENQSLFLVLRDSKKFCESFTRRVSRFEEKQKGDRIFLISVIRLHSTRFGKTESITTILKQT